MESSEVISEVLPGAVENLLSSSALPVPPKMVYCGSAITFNGKTEPSSPPLVNTVTHSPDSSNLSNFSCVDSESELCELSISDDQLLKISTRNLNRQIRNLRLDEQQKLKNRRRTLKNRYYAQTCRTRRVGLRSELQADNERLSAQIERLSADKTSLTVECDRLRKGSAGLSAEQLHGEIEKLRTQVDFLTSERDMLCVEGARVRGERDVYKNRLNLLRTFLVSNGFVEDDSVGKLN